MANKPAAKKKTTASAASKSRSTGTKKPSSAAKSSAAKKKSGKEKRSPRAVAEIIGIVLIALGALFAVYLYSGSNDPLGKIISSYLLGMHGVFGYAVPVIFILIGFFLILGGRKSPARGTLLTSIAVFWFVLCALHMWTADSQLKNLHQFGEQGYKFFDYVTQFFKQFSVAWNEGVQLSRGGGVLGMILPTLLYVLGGKLLCWVVIIAGFLIAILLCTGISIRAYTQAFGDKVMEKIEEREQSLAETFEDEDEEPEPARKPWKKGFSTTIEDDPFDQPTPARRPAPAKKKKTSIPFDELFDVPEAQSPAKSGRFRSDALFRTAQ